MMASIKARYANGVLTPLEPLDLEDGAEVTVSIADDRVATVENTAVAKRGLAAIAERVAEIHKSMPPGAWDDLPTDLAKNKKHYLYGHPKEEG